MAVKIPIKTEGGKQAADELKRVGDSGKSAMDRINRASREPAAGLKALNGVTSELRGGLDGLSGRAGVLGGILTRLGPVGLGVAAGIGAAGIALRTLMNEADRVDRLGKLADSVGLTVEALSALEYSASLNNVSLGQLTGSLKQLSVNAIDTAKGTGEAKLAFAALNIDVRDTNGVIKNTDALLGEIATKFAAAEDGATKTAIAAKLLGGSGADLIPLLNNGADGLAQMADEANRFGNIVTSEAARAAAEFNDNLTRMNAASRNFKLSMANELLPGLSEITTAMAVAAKEAGLLKAAWVGLGGLGAALYTDAFDNDMEKLRQLRIELSGLQRRLRNKESQSGLLHDWLFGDELDIQDKIDGVVHEMSELQQRIDAATKSHEGLGNAAASGKAQLKDLGDETQKLSAALKREQAEMERVARAQQAATQSIEKQIEGYQNEQVALQLGDRERAIYVETLKAEETARRAGLELAHEQREAIERETGALYDQRQAIEARKNAAEEDRKTQEKAADERKRLAEREAEAMRRPFEVAAEGVQNSFTNAFENIYSGNVRRFSDMAGQIKSVFVRLAAEVSTLLIFNPRASVGSLVGGMGLFGSSPATAGAQMATGGGGGLSVPPGTTSLAQAGGGFGGAFMGAGLGAFYGYEKGGTRGAVVGGLAGYAGGAALTAGGTALAAGWGAGASAGAGLAGASSALAAIPGWGWAALAALAVFGGGKNKPSNKSAWGGVDLLSGELSGLGSMTGKKFSQETNDARDAMLQGVAALSASLREFTGGSLTGSVGVEVGQRDGTVVTGLGAGRYAGPQEAMDAITQAMLGSLTGVSHEFQAVFDRIDFSDLEKGVQDLGIAATIINRDFEMAEPISQAAVAVKAINDGFGEMITQANRLGISTSALVAEQQKQLQLLTSGFDTAISDAILAITDPLEFALQEQGRVAEERLQNARDLGANLAEVERLNALERERIMEQSHQALVSANQSIEQFLTGLRSGTSSFLSPQARLANAEAEFQALLQAAQGGDVTARGGLTGSAGNLLDASRDVFGSSEMFFQRLGFIDQTLSNLVGQTSATAPIDGLGITISEGNAESHYLLEQVVQRLDRVVDVVADQQATLARLVNA